jgi:5-hydroxyisourate hydrolase
MSTVSTHVLDTARGLPAPGVRVELCAFDQEWKPIASAITDADGRIKSIAPDQALEPGSYRLVFDTGAYQDGFYPEVIVTFRIDASGRHYHVPLLLSPYGYSTYRGS